MDDANRFIAVSSMRGAERLIEIDSLDGRKNAIRYQTPCRFCLASLRRADDGNDHCEEP